MHLWTVHPFVRCLLYHLYLSIKKENLCVKTIPKLTCYLASKYKLSVDCLNLYHNTTGLN